MNKEDRKVEIVCKGCGCRIFDVETQEDSDDIALKGVTILCHRCGRALTFKRFTERELRRKAKQKKVNGTLRWQMYI